MTRPRITRPDGVIIRSIWAQSSSGAIGDAGGMLWNVPEDFAYFKRATVGLPVVMGRKTWESFPDSVRPLPNRPNIVVTRDAEFLADGGEVVGSIDEAFRVAARHDDEIWVIGGATLYAQTLGVVDEVWLTEIDSDVDGDAHAPRLGSEWSVAKTDPEESGQWHTSRTGTRYRFVVYVRGGSLEP